MTELGRGAGGREQGREAHSNLFPFSQTTREMKISYPNPIALPPASLINLKWSLAKIFLLLKSMTLKFTVPNMSCSVCANNITNALKAVDVNATVEADPQTKLVSVDTQASETLIKEALAAAGYPAT